TNERKGERQCAQSHRRQCKAVTSRSDLKQHPSGVYVSRLLRSSPLASWARGPPPGRRTQLRPPTQPIPRSLPSTSRSIWPPTRGHQLESRREYSTVSAKTPRNRVRSTSSL